MGNETKKKLKELKAKQVKLKEEATKFHLEMINRVLGKIELSEREEEMLKKIAKDGEYVIQFTSIIEKIKESKNEQN